MGTTRAEVGEAGDRIRASRRYLALIAGAAALFYTMTLPWWSIILYAPQYPQGLKATTYLTRMTGDVNEINTLNHYIGMMPLDQSAPMERRIAPYAVSAAAALTVVSALTRGVVAWLLRLPLMSFPLFFVADLNYWLYYAGHHLDPGAPLSGAIGAFTPRFLGSGRIAQFSTSATLESGFFLALGAAVLVLAVSLRGAGTEKEG